MLVLGLIEVPLWLLLLIFILFTVRWYMRRNYDYFTKQGVPGPSPRTFVGTIFYKTDIYTADIEIHKEFGKVCGMFLLSKPELLVFDEDLINEVAIKQFQNFADRRPDIFHSKYLEGSLFVLEEERWRTVRSHMSPTFTTGKLRKMTTEINRCAQALAQRLISHGKPFEAKHFAEAYTMDCIASTAFGVRLDSQSEKDNEFTVHGKKLLEFSFATMKYLLLNICFPGFRDMLERVIGHEISNLNEESMRFFKNVIEQAFERRNVEDETRADFLQLMVKAHSEENIGDKSSDPNRKGLSKEEILANALLFFMAGYDTVSIALTQLMYRLACNQACQDKLLEEMDEVIEEGEVSYDVISKMHYLDACLNESLRLHPPAFRVDRRATRDTELGGVKIKKGMMVNIPILAIHKDPEIWPEPEKFDPDRFSPEKKASIRATQFMPFGIGPRNCIGMRQAQFEIKIAVVELLKTHRLITCEKTEIPLTLSRKYFMKAENGVWLAVESLTA